MTGPEKMLWAATYAAAWASDVGRCSDLTNDEDRARAIWSARQACRAVAALKSVAQPEARLWSTDTAIDFLKE